MTSQNIEYDQDQIDTIRYWQQQMQDKDLGGMGYDGFVDKYGPVLQSKWNAWVDD